MRTPRTTHLLLASMSFVIPAGPLLAQHTEHRAQEQTYYSTDIETMEGKFIELAEAFPADKYSWRPMEGTRTVSQVFMLIVAENYAIPSMWGAGPAEGVPAGNEVFQTMPQVTDKAEVMDHLRKSFTYYRSAVDNLDAESLHRTVQFFGQERTVNESIFIITGDMHEHLGQAIAYARMNQIVPPWTARQAN